jgi:hypothetical protein
MIEIVIKGTAEELEALCNGGGPLRSLCQKEVEIFDQYLRSYGRGYEDGLARFERYAIEGYLYQKIRGHLDETKAEDTATPGRQDGQA